MKKYLALLLAMMMCFALVSCGGEVTDMEVNGENTTVSDFLITTLREYMESDGYLARKNNQVTNFGKFMDPVADKLLVMAALLIFVEDGTIAAWMVAIILGREFIVSALRMVAASEGLVIAANYWGKAKTMITMITLIFLLCPIGPVMLGPVSLQTILIWITVIITAISGVTYIIDNFSVIKDGFTQKGA